MKEREDSKEAPCVWQVSFTELEILAEDEASSLRHVDFHVLRENLTEGSKLEIHIWE